MAQPQAEALAPEREPLQRFFHNAAVAGAVVTPLVMLLPPRKMDIRFFVLAGTFSLATNHLAYEYTGQSVYTRFGNRVSSIFDTSLPEGAKRTQQLLREQKERDAAQKQQKSLAEQNKTHPIKDIWMGNEGEGWKQKRAEEHQKSFDEGKGLSDIIFEQVGEVWSGLWRQSPKKDDGSKANDAEQADKK